MKLVVVNGSPRGRKSNSDKIIQWPLSEIKIIQDFVYEEVYVVDLKEREKQMEVLKTADYILVIFPLYTDSMPGITKEFFEHMERNKKFLSGKPISFIIHSGFPEAYQSRTVEKYTEYFSRLLDMKYMGSIVMGGSEALSAAPESMFTKKINAFKSVGRSIAEYKEFEKSDKVIISKPETLPKPKLFIMKYLNVSNIFWNRHLKKNNAYEKRFDRPYL
jgi:multimeric flavodoxin WrbA